MCCMRSVLRCVDSQVYSKCNWPIKINELWILAVHCSVLCIRQFKCVIAFLTIVAFSFPLLPATSNQ